MSPIDKESVNDKLVKLNQCIAKLEKLVPVSKRDFIKDSVTGDSACYNFIIAIEAITDIGNHLLAEMYNDPALNYKDIILKLGKRGIIGNDFALEQQEMPAFRNKLVHDYDIVNSELVYDYLQKAPAIFKTFAKAFADAIEKQ